MKKIFIVFLILICGPVFATSMCVNDDTVAVVLDASINGTGGSNSPIKTGTGDWNVTFSYGRVYGISACVSKNYGSVVNEITDNGAIITGGEANGGTCYCKMLHPAVSAWALSYSTSATVCASSCAANCDTGNGLRQSTSFRMSVFGSIAQ